MKQLNPKLIATVRSGLSGKKLEKFDASIAILNESLKQGAWTPRGSVKANSGFYQGIARSGFDRKYGGLKGKAEKAQESGWVVEHCLNFGGGIHEDRNIDIDLGIKAIRDGRQRDGEPTKLKISDEVVKAWLALCNEKNKAYQILNEARPKPVLTKILLSPKVTKTLTEMNLDIDLPSIKMPKIEEYEVPATVDGKPIYRTNRDGSYLLDENGKKVPLIWKMSRIIWSKGIKHGMSRFGSNGGCEACGKHIPSYVFVPVEAKDKKSGNLISLWLGCDCARNIFGVKDIGVRKDGKPIDYKK